MITRRQILSAGTSAAIVLPTFSPVSALAAVATSAASKGNTAAAATPSVLTLKHLHTHETSHFKVSDSSRLTKQDVARFNHFMRDHHNGQIGSMDPNLLLHLLSLQQVLEVKDTAFEVLSAFRSHQTNAKLRRRSKRVAVKSMHLKGQAIDIRLPGVKLADLHAAALDLKVGGVGLYRRSKFIHLDTGRVRRW